MKQLKIKGEKRRKVYFVAYASHEDKDVTICYSPNQNDLRTIISGFLKDNPNPDAYITIRNKTITEDHFKAIFG